MNKKEKKKLKNIQTIPMVLPPLWNTYTSDNGFGPENQPSNRQYIALREDLGHKYQSDVISCIHISVSYKTKHVLQK